MRELTYTLLELEREYKGGTCDFCSNKGVNQITTRVKINGRYVSDDVVCKNCKERFENDELPKCNRCGRLQTQLDIDMFCSCIRHNEDLEEKEFSASPPRESMSTFYERQINDLREKLTTAEKTIEEEREAHEDFMEKSEEWSKRQKQELIEENKRLKEENDKLKEENSQLIAQIEVLSK